MGREHRGAGAAGQCIYMPLQRVYAVGVQHQRLFHRQETAEQQVALLAPSHAAAHSHGVAAGGAAAYLLLGVGRQPPVLLRQRMGHGAPALHRRRRPHALRHAQKHQPAAAALRGGGAQHRRAGIAHAASQQIDLSERALVSRRVAAGHQAPHIFPVDGPHGAPPPAFLYSIAHVSIIKAAFFVSRREKSACIFCFVVI